MLTYGFYNSINHDRRYDAVQVSQLFDGLIRDGVYQSIGERFRVTPIANSMELSVGAGRAWLNHTWTLNDNAYVLPINNPADAALPRIDTVVIRVNALDRFNQIDIVYGEFSSNPTRPALTKTEGVVYEWPIADIYIRPGATQISQADITNRVGTVDLPFVTGIVEILTMEMFTERWEAEWYERADEYIYNKGVSFELWFNSLVASLDGNVAANLASRLALLEQNPYAEGNNLIFRKFIKDQNYVDILGSDNTTLEGVLMVELKQRG